MPEENANVTRIDLEGKKLILIGTAHVSKQSAEQVKEVIDTEQPDSVCIELDAGRYQSMVEGNKWKETDIFKIIKEKKATLLLINLALSSFQKRMAKQFGIQAGQDMRQGMESAKEIGAKLVLADRNIQVTFSRIWHGVGFGGKAKLLMQIFASIFTSESISEEDLEQLKSEDSLNTILHEFTETFPKLKRPLVDERDQYLSQKIKDAPGSKVVAVLGAAHVPGIKKEINKEHDLARLSQKPVKKSWIPKTIGWSIPVLILAAIIYTYIMSPSTGLHQSVSWILWNGSLSALGAALALAHPLTILTAFVAAPFTSLNPLIAAGWVAGIVQALIQRPHVGDFENLSEDVHSVKGFWHNKVTRILLIVIFANIGSSIGTAIGGIDVIRLFFENF